jgi:osmotically-inducible protein OsmY
MVMKTNTELKQDVIDELNWEPTVIGGIVTPSDNPKIEVSVINGVVTLNGEVDSYAKKWSAYRAVRRVVGVKEVVDKIKVELSDSFKLTDEEIRRAAVHAIELNVSIPHDRINVKVQQGSITLTGEVDWAYQREAAKEETYHLRGVVWVDDQITIKPVEPVDLKAKIEGAFRRNALLNSNRIGVEINVGEVILRGSVQSWAEKEEALRIVWAARGVSEIDDHILINSLAEQ